jgi:hypothetical protein
MQAKHASNDGNNNNNNNNSAGGRWKNAKPAHEATRWCPGRCRDIHRLWLSCIDKTLHALVLARNTNTTTATTTTMTTTTGTTTAGTRSGKGSGRSKLSSPLGADAFVVAGVDVDCVGVIVGVCVVPCTCISAVDDADACVCGICVDAGVDVDTVVGVDVDTAVGAVVDTVLAGLVVVVVVVVVALARAHGLSKAHSASSLTDQSSFCASGP